MTETFSTSIKATVESVRSQEPRVRETKLGHGYSQISGDGINNNLEVWELTFQCNSTDKSTVDTFFKTAGGYIPFYWTSNESGATKKKYLCRRWSIKPLGYNQYIINASFEEWPI